MRYFKLAIALVLAQALHLLLFPFVSDAQTPLHQTIKGVVLDKALKAPLAGATIRLLSVEPTKGAISDENGRFRIEQIPVGQHILQVTFMGYKDAVIPNITLNSGKETELNIEMEENIISGKEVVITARVEKQKPLNELAAVSARTFSVEETRRFAAAVNDPARMASSFAGVAMPADGNNIIVIRGNAPNGLLWRMEGVDIPNPNHFSNAGSSGGGISILSAQLLTNSDFMTGAFPAEYGNALSGVFDLKLRKGNSDRREYTFQAGVLGLDAAAEGPMRLGKNNGSYLINYRYSTLSVLAKLGVPLGDATTNFQDLSFNLWMPAGKAGVFTLFGMGGKSDQRYLGKKDSIAWDEDINRQFDGVFLANSGVSGITHSLLLNDRTALKTVVAFSATENGDQTDRYNDQYQLYRVSDNSFIQQKWTVSSTINHKWNSRHLLRAGAYANFMNYRLRQKQWDNEAAELIEQINDKGQSESLNGFAQWQYRPSEKWTFNAGLHSLVLLLNNTWSLEPRGSVKYAFGEKQTISLGYGKHSQMQPLGQYFMKIEDENGQLTQPNKELGLTQAHHVVLSYDQSFSGKWHIKPELYYQAIQNVPVNARQRDEFSMLNNVDGFKPFALKNTGTGRNYGLELTVEKFLQNGFYGMLSSAVFKSEYRGSDGVWHNTRFNAGTVSSVVAGKEWAWNTRRKNRSIGINLKFTHSGGLRETPIDLEASKLKGETVYDTQRAFEDIMPYYMRLDAGIRLKRNYKKVTTTLSLDAQNATNRKNVFGRYYDERQQKIITYYQAPLIPILAYKLEFGR